MLEDNPLKAARTRLGLGRSEFALRAGLTYTQVASAELGHPRTIAPAWRAGLAALGLDYDTIAADYQAWRRRAADKAVANG